MVLGSALLVIQYLIELFKSLRTTITEKNKGENEWPV